MQDHPKSSLVNQLRRLIGAPATVESGDGPLLRQFAEHHDEGAFALLVQRHGPLVMRVCRQILNHADDADDAFQATFLILARKAGSIRSSEALPSWLYRVAYHVAGQAKVRAAHRRTRERQVAVSPQTDADPSALHDVWPLLHEEVNHLPAKYRTPVVLCYLDGKTNEQAAQELGCPVGTLKIRLTRARDRLRDRLTRRGVVLSGGIAAVLTEAGSATAALPAGLMDSTIQAAELTTAGEAALATTISTQVSSLVEGVLHTMLLNRLKPIALGVLLLAVVGGGLGWFWPTSQAADPAKPFKAVPLDSPQVKTDKAAVVQGNTEFAFDLYGKLRQEKGNLFLSPYSISTALAMTTNGARANTLSQMEKTLRFPVEQDRLHRAFGALLQDSKAGKGYQLSVANALWCQINYPILDGFLKSNETYYAGTPTGVDFLGKTEEARRTINAWVEKQTQDKIKELLKPDVLSQDTRVVLTNAIYFKGDWASKFKKEATRDEPFVSASGQKTKTPLMHQKGKFKYLDGGDFQALEMPYVGQELSLVALLPKKADGLPDFEKQLTEANLAKWLAGMREREIAVAFPKFKVEAEFLLNDVLAGMGMSDAFRSGTADFSGINGRKKDLFISAVVHKAFVEIHEEGSEAAAATAVVLDTKSARVEPVFRADRPFLFLIRDNRSGSILFLGRLVEPQK
jgi:serpin B